MLTQSLPLGRTISALREGGLTARSLLKSCLDRADEVEPKLHTLLAEPERRARLEPEIDRLGRRWPNVASRPPLFGIPVGVKDLFRVDGLPTRAGSALPIAHFAGPEAGVVKRLSEAGALVFGKTATDEFAYADPPATRNPHELARSPGGSSAGSAAGVAAGVFPLALGTQTSRSIIAPAAWCGVVGFKPSHGRVPLDGVVLMAPSLDVVGWLTQDAVGAYFAAYCLLDNWRPMENLREPVLGIPGNDYLAGLPDLGWRAPFDACFASLPPSVTTRPCPIAWPTGLENVYGGCMTLLHGEMWHQHEARFAEFGTLYRAASRSGVERGRAIPEAEVRRARNLALEVRGAIEAAMDQAGVDALISPSQPGPPPLVGGATGSGATTSPWSYAGLPCISVPCGRIGGLPAGMQLIGRHGSDELILHAASFFEPVWALL
ncbi:MAG: amidase [Planctomycetes bacterium]|nr:amidase [Planctomycetota bacterium]